MTRLLSTLLLPILLAQWVVGQGVFTDPAGLDGQNTYTAGTQLDVSWTGTEAYYIFSLGYYSGTNQTITWLISNSETFPTSYNWIIDPASAGFDLASSRTFRMLATNGTAFGNEFVSTSFTVLDAPAVSSTTTVPSGPSSSSASSTSSTPSTTSSSAAPATVTVTTTGAPASSTATPLSTPSSGVSAGAKAGIGVGVLLGAIAVAALIFFVMRARRKSNRSTGAHAGNTTAATSEYQPNVKHELYGNSVAEAPAYSEAPPGGGQHYAAELEAQNPTSQRSYR